MKDKVRPSYSELQGYLSQTPAIKNNYDAISERTFWEQINLTIDELNSATGKDYSKYKLVPEQGDEIYIRLTVVRLKLGGIISRLHGEYFSDEAAPFSGMPSTVNNFTQMQQQAVTQTIVLEFQDLLNKKIAATPNEDEKSFLEKIKSSLGNVKSTVELVKVVLDIANQMGLDVNHVLKIFS